MISSFIALSTSVRLFRENLASGYGGREIRFALVNFTGLSLVTRSPARWSLTGIPEHRDAFKIVRGDLESSIADILEPRARFRFRFLTCLARSVSGPPLRQSPRQNDLFRAYSHVIFSWWRYYHCNDACKR